MAALKRIAQYRSHAAYKSDPEVANAVQKALALPANDMP
jgi:hypothetical protein